MTAPPVSVPGYQAQRPLTRYHSFPFLTRSPPSSSSSPSPPPGTRLNTRHFCASPPRPPVLFALTPRPRPDPTAPAPATSRSSSSPTHYLSPRAPVGPRPVPSPLSVPIGALGLGFRCLASPRRRLALPGEFRLLDLVLAFGSGCAALPLLGNGVDLRARV
jgi:hypothetical protein